MLNSFIQICRNQYRFFLYSCVWEMDRYVNILLWNSYEWIWLYEWVIFYLKIITIIIIHFQLQVRNNCKPNMILFYWGQRITNCPGGVCCESQVIKDNALDINNVSQAKWNVL